MGITDLEIKHLSHKYDSDVNDDEEANGVGTDGDDGDEDDDVYDDGDED